MTKIKVTLEIEYFNNLKATEKIIVVCTDDKHIDELRKYIRLMIAENSYINLTCALRNEHVKRDTTEIKYIKMSKEYLDKEEIQ